MRARQRTCCLALCACVRAAPSLAVFAPAWSVLHGNACATALGCMLPSWAAQPAVPVAAKLRRKQPSAGPAGTGGIRYRGEERARGQVGGRAGSMCCRQRVRAARAGVYTCRGRLQRQAAEAGNARSHEVVLTSVRVMIEMGLPSESTTYTRCILPATCNTAWGAGAQALAPAGRAGRTSLTPARSGWQAGPHRPTPSPSTHTHPPLNPPACRAARPGWCRQSRCPKRGSARRAAPRRSRRRRTAGWQRPQQRPGRAGRRQTGCPPAGRWQGAGGGGGELGQGGVWHRSRNASSSTVQRKPRGHPPSWAPPPPASMPPSTPIHCHLTSFPAASTRPRQLLWSTAMRPKASTAGVEAGTQNTAPAVRPRASTLRAGRQARGWVGGRVGGPAGRVREPGCRRHTGRSAAHPRRIHPFRPAQSRSAASPPPHLCSAAPPSAALLAASRRTTSRWLTTWVTASLPEEEAAWVALTTVVAPACTHSTGRGA